jgi:phospholipase/carboxylesterase
MQTKNEPVTFEFSNRIVRYKKSLAGSTSSILVLIHGLTGNENSMWVFASKLPDTTTILAPRAPLNAPTTGFSWVNIEQSKEKILLDLQNEARKFHNWLIQFLQFKDVSGLPIHLAGFSQGASMVYLLMLLFPEIFHSAICMSGFLPAGAESWITPEKVANARFFISHGNKDKVIPVSQARLAATLLKEAGAQVIYCEEDTTHKMSPVCQKKLQSYMANILV